MAISTTIACAAAPYTNVSPIDFTVTFGAVVSGLTIDDFDVVNGSIINFEGSGANYNVTVSPDEQGVDASLFLPAGVVTGALAEPNSESNLLVIGFDSTQPESNIEYQFGAVTNRRAITLTVTFERDVTGIDENSFTISNATVFKVSGTGSAYELTIQPTSPGPVEIYVTGGVGSDVYGNSVFKSNVVIFVFDPTSLDAKTAATYGEIDNPEILLNFELSELGQVVEINRITDCSKNIGQRLMQFAVDKTFEYLSNNQSAKSLAGYVSVTQQSVDTVKRIADQVEEYAAKPETLLQAILETNGLTGNRLRAKVQEIADRFSGVAGITSIIQQIKATGICDNIDYYSDGSIVPKRTLTPTDVPPKLLPGIIAGVGTNRYDPNPKDRYDQFAFNIREQLELDDVQSEDTDLNRMMSIVTTLAMGYHDSISQAKDESSDDEIHQVYLDNVDNEIKNNAGWSSEVKESFINRTSIIGDQIKRNSNDIRYFINRNNAYK